MFDLPAHSESEFRIRVDMPIEDKPWKLGLITGASGTGKSTVARDRFTMVNHHSWEAPSLVDDFPAHMTPTEITNLLVSVGLSSSPAWLRPYRVLSTGQQFRADLARPPPFRIRCKNAINNNCRPTSRKSYFPSHASAWRR